jgi:hypothetical protein
MAGIRYDPESTSDILRATHIVEVAVESAEVSEWRRVSGRLLQRDLELTLRLVEVFKGEPELEPGATFAMHAVQSAPAIPRFFKVPGVWSGYQPKPGDRFVVFWIGREPIRVVPSTAAAEDVRRAARAGVPELSIGATILASAAELEQWGFLFAQYLEARLPECFFDDYGSFDIYVGIVEDPRLSQAVRNVLMSAAYTKMMLYDPAPPVFVARLLAATARVLPTPQGANLREAVLSTYLPNLLGLNGGIEAPSGTDVLAAAGPTRDVIQTYLDGLASAPIAGWVRS